jgi:hypothetical protein
MIIVVIRYTQGLLHIVKATRSKRLVTRQDSILMGDRFRFSKLRSGRADEGQPD